MKHISKFDGYEYEITYSVDYEGDKVLNDDIILIWRDAPCGIGNAFLQDIPPRTLVGWYYGEYDEAIVENYIKYYWKKQLAESEVREQKQLKILDLPICYVNFITDCLEAVQKHNLYSLLSYDDDCVEDAKGHLEEVLGSFCKPLEEYGDDTEIILED